MKMHLLGAFGLVACASPAWAQQATPHWNTAQVGQLKLWVQDAEADGLPLLDRAELDRAAVSADAVVIDRAAQALALRLARMHLHGCAPAAERAGWNIPDTGDDAGLEVRLAAALAANTLDAFFASLKPRHPDYAALRAAYAAETDAARRATLARNLERWRWMPHALGSRYVLVNAASFEASLWKDGQRAGTWPVIVGKPGSPTPVFSATIAGVIFNPWWEIPANIVRESVGALTRRNPALARQRGYVWGGGSYRQRPGPGNSLGQMKLVMPNPYSVYLHDTPGKALFARDVRAFSHGCVRVGDAMGFAATLVDGVKSRAEVDAIVRAGRTTQVAVPAPLPVYITYFTASTTGSSSADGSVVFSPDIYGRDKRMGDARNPNRLCAA